MTLAELYRLFRDKDETARQLLDQTHWFAAHSEFDPKTEEALPQALTAFLARVANDRPRGRLQDRLYRIIEHSRLAIERLLGALNESPRREHAHLPVRAVRELDAVSFIKLSMRPGRNIREKLASKPYLQAVRRFQSVDLPENRLLKAYVSLLAEFLELRREFLDEPEDELLPRIRSWLLSDEAKSISDWENAPPNNTLLSHRDYRRVWDSWRRLQTLDNDILRDLSRIKERQATMDRWKVYARKHREGMHRFAEMPVLFDYENFTIRTWAPEPLLRETEHRIGRSSHKKEITQPACVDLTEIRPRFAVPTKGTQELMENFVWQQWRNATETVDITLFDSDAAYFHPDATTIAFPDLFFAGDKTAEHSDRAARAFVARLRKTFRNDTLIWLVPDVLNDFELEVIRRNINARFPEAAPLPRSVAALFEEVDYSKINNDGFPVVVVDTIGGRTCITKLIARFDPKLEKCLPETKGYYWERCPSVIISAEEAAEKEPSYNMITVDEGGRWHDNTRPKSPQFIDPKRLKADPRIGQFAFCISLSNSPVTGGIRLYALQKRARDIPLWRDQIPELSIRVMKDGRYQRFYLVSRGTTIKPIRGLSIRIPIAERFKLPAGKRFYQFPLYQDENAAELRFSARLDSPAFPLKSDTVCELLLTFQYGADDPYTLVFAPLDESFPLVRATWQRTVEEIVTDAPVPIHPTPMSWDDLRRMPKPNSQETSDLLEWVVSATDRFESDVCSLFWGRPVGRLITEWRVDRNGYHYAFAECLEVEENVFIHENNFLKGIEFSSFQKGDALSFRLEKQEQKYKGYKGVKVAPPDYNRETEIEEVIKEVIEGIRRRLYFPIIQVWRDGRSITDKQCPRAFATTAKKKIAYLANLTRENELPQLVKNEVLFLLACLHKDTTDECVQWLTEKVDTKDIRSARAVGFALGDVSQDWQQRIFRQLALNPGKYTIRAFAYAIWREQHVVDQFTLAELKKLVNALLRQLDEIRPPRVDNDGANGKGSLQKWNRATAETLELLLGLLRTRASTNTDIKMLLQPHQQITKQFAEQVDRVEDILAKADIKLLSRLSMDIKKPDDVSSSDLLYALRLYLTGDDGSHAIRITRITETDNDNDE